MSHPLKFSALITGTATIALLGGSLLLRRQGKRG